MLLRRVAEGIIGIGVGRTGAGGAVVAVAVYGPSGIAMDVWEVVGVLGGFGGVGWRDGEARLVNTLKFKISVS